MARRTLSIALIAAAFLALAPTLARSQTLPPGFYLEDAFPNATFYLPTLLVFMPDQRKLVVEKEGRIWVITPEGDQLSTPFIDISDKVLSDDDRGLHGVALDPDFATNRWVYLLYTVDPDSDGVDDNIGAFARLERYQTDLSNPDVLDLSTRQILIGATWATGIPEPPRAMHHMVGTLRFAPDKTLLIGAGDAADADIVDAGGTDPQSSFGPGRTDPAEDIGAFRARTLDSMDGKILRVDKDTGDGLPSNPYWDGNPTSDRSRVWLYGLRNPFRFCLRPGTGSTNPADGDPGVIYLGDVGWNTTEELSIARGGGLNLGWPCIEGADPQPGYQAVDSTYYPNPNVICSADTSSENPRYPTPPALWWDHQNGANSFPVGWVGNCAIGGVFYTGLSYPAEYRGAYFIGDYGANWIRRVVVDSTDNVVSTSDFIDGGGAVVDIESDPLSGDLFYVDIARNRIVRIGYSSGNLPPVVVASMVPTSGYAPLNVTATASGSTDPDNDPLTFLWDFGDGGTSHSADTTYVYQNAGTYHASVTVSDGNGGNSLAPFTIVVGQTAPPGSILEPPDSTFFYQNASLSLVASPVDTSQGSATYRWDIDLHHNNHVHPAVETYYGQSTSFLPSTPNDGDYYHLGIRLSVTQGAITSRDTVEIWPRLNIVPTWASIVPSSPPADSTFQMMAMLHSVGEIGTSPSSYQVLHGANIVGSGQLPPIMNGDSLLVTASINPLPGGTQTLTFVADPGNQLYETDESDNAVTTYVPVRGLVAAYAMDEGSGSTAADASGNAIAGSIQGATWTTDGEFGDALSFGGSGDYVDLGNPAPLKITGSMTWSAWVKLEGYPADDGQIISKSGDGGASSGWQFKTSPDTGPRTFGIAVSGNGSSLAQRYSATVCQLDTWYYVAGVYDVGDQSLHIYVNGAPDDGVLTGTVPASLNDPNVSVNIGRRAGGYYFNGIIDEVRVYNRALTQPEIVQDMNTPITAPLVRVPEEPSNTGIPSAYSLSLANPNPFGRRTALRYTIPDPARVRVDVFNVSGEKVATLEDGMRAAGTYQVIFEPKNLPSGVYVCRIQAGPFVASRKLFVLR